MVIKHSDGPSEKQRSSKLVPKSTQKNQQIENSQYKERQTDRKTNRQTDTITDRWLTKLATVLYILLPSAGTLKLQDNKNARQYYQDCQCRKMQDWKYHELDT